MTCDYEYEYEFDEAAVEVKCSLDKGHAGTHHATLEFDWPTRPIDICRELGHVWGPWRPDAPPDRADISEVLFGSLMGGGRLERIKVPTQERNCDRCGRYDNDGESRWVGMSPMPYISGTDLGTDSFGTKLTWAEDRLNGP